MTARWIDPVRRQGALKPYGRAGEQTTLVSLQTALDEAGRDSVTDPVRTRLAASAQADIGDLLPHLERRADEVAELAKRRLAERSETEQRSMVVLLERQRQRIAEAAGKDDGQMMFDFDRGRTAPARGRPSRLDAAPRSNRDRTRDRTGPNRRCVQSACRPCRSSRPRPTSRPRTG